MYSMAHVACKNWHPDTTSGTYLPPNTREASYAISPIGSDLLFNRDTRGNRRKVLKGSKKFHDQPDLVVNRASRIRTYLFAPERIKS